ncbi:ABC-2 type transport system ATP-binding protein [Jatrophihabitans endophyticus]|uniref:ABC-2 type transport system ATP-binding protein n=1 Tax=Jatrophihabitans endophyticus TaxID=1206085 RepID=A0A1M5TTD7_9ACTN|nr:alpha/beta fold hydrolase [Jatrophihabitans endophyticus]SHH53938.1 ABC-2 type transport system ATP-binding protein [Jatrophihabitans endophyticus]
MTLGALRERLRSRTVLIVLLGVVIAAGLITTLAVTGADPTVRSRSQFVTGTPEPDGTAVRLDTTLYLPETTPAPAVLLTQGFGGDKSGLRSDAERFARSGYVVLTYTARGFGKSGGKIHFASPRYEVADAKLLVTYLSQRDEVKRSGGQAQIAAAGSSYGGGLSLLLAGYDPRVKAVSADITWNDLEQAFFPNFGGTGPGPFKKLWVGQLFGNGFGDRTSGGLQALLGGRREPTVSGTPTCGRFAADVCRAYQQSAARGAPTAALRTLMREASPATILSRIKAPTQLTQGEQDSLFPLSQADANARGIAATGTPVSVSWRAGGHDNSAAGGSTAANNAISWFGKVFAGDDLRGAQPFTYSQDDGVISAETGDSERSTMRAAAYPTLAFGSGKTTGYALTGRPQTVSSPAGGVPAVITSIPGLGGISGRFDRALAVLPSAPGQTALFSTATIDNDTTVVGRSNVRITVTARNSTDTVLFAGLRDLAPDGSYTLPSQLVSPLRVTGLTPGQPKTVDVALPTVVQHVLPGHRLVLSVSTSDFAYAGPAEPRSYTIGLAAEATPLRVASGVKGTEVSGGFPLGWLFAGLGACLLVALLVGAVFLRRRRVLRPDPDLTDVPVSVRNLVKEYSGGYRAVDDISFRVEKGQVVGLLGPNGAGKTTALRVLVGLITPTSGELHVFGQPVAPGAPVLSRLGSFIEGPGFLPHLTGRENLRLYWAATGRPDDEAEFTVALDIAGLGGSIDRRVRTYSQGMRQRLGIAQAMLGLPELLVLDEPTNGLDPPQIAEMREVMKQYADTGRTVVVSSHLLSEVEQTCTHVVVMHKGRVVSAGSVDEISGTDGAQLAVGDPARAAEILAAAGVDAELVPARRSLEDVFLELIGEEVDVSG